MTHIITTQEGYEKKRDFFDELSEKISITVIESNAKIVSLEKNNFESRNGFSPVSDKIQFVRRPVFTLPFINILNGDTLRDSADDTRHFICRGIRALVVDDDEMNLMVAEGILRNYEIETSLAISGKDAVSMCKKQDFDIIFLDHMMPEMDGVECLRILRSLNPHNAKDMIAVALTANAVSGAREMFLSEGFDEFIAKPIERNLFERTLKKVLPQSMIQFVDTNKLKPESLTVGEAKNQGRTFTELLSEFCESLESLDQEASASILDELSSTGMNGDFSGEIAQAFFSDAKSAIGRFDFESVLFRLNELQKEGAL